MDGEVGFKVSSEKLTQNIKYIMLRLDHANTDVKGKTTDFKHEQNQVLNNESKI